MEKIQREDLLNLENKLTSLYKKYTNRTNTRGFGFGGWYRCNYAFTRPINSDKSLTAYYSALKDCSTGASPKIMARHFRSLTNRSHFYNYGFVEKKNGLWYTNQWGNEYIEIVERWLKKIK